MDRGGEGMSMERVLAILEALIAFPTVSSQSNLALIAWVEALLADAGHMLSDVASLALSLFALWFASRPATSQRSYGYYRAEI